MSNLEKHCTPSVSSDCPAAAQQPACRVIDTRDAVLGEDLTIRRALPSRHQRMIGAWCFLDHAGPANVSTGGGIRVGPHPHTGLQTFTWPLAGELLHRDSLGYEQLIRPGQVNLMTAGRGISHSEESPAERSPQFHGAQLWIALPDAVRHMEPAFEHYPSQPEIDRDGFRITVLAGEALGELAPARVYTPLVGMDLATDGEADCRLPLNPDFEYAGLVLEGALQIADQPLAIGQLLYLGCGREVLPVSADAPARLLLLGGEPFGEEVLLWWNFVGRSKQEMTQATEDWNNGTPRFGEVKGYDGPPLTAPPVPWE